MVNDTEYGIIWSRMGQHISVAPWILLDDELPPLFHRYVSFCAWCFLPTIVIIVNPAPMMDFGVSRKLVCKLMEYYGILWIYLQ